MIKTGYKLTTKLVDGTETSLIFGYTSDVIYKKYHWTYPQDNCGPLAVFDTLENAKKLLNEYRDEDSCRIHECEYIPAIGETNLWMINDQDDTECSNFYVKGTIFAAAVRLLD